MTLHLVRRLIAGLLMLFATPVVVAVTADNRPAPSTSDAGYWTQQAELLVASNPTAALDAIDKALALEDAAYRRYDKGLILQRLGRNREAIAEFERARVMDPKNPNILFALAYAYRVEGHNADAAATFEAALKADPSQYRAIEDWAYALKSDGQNAAAVAKFRQVIDNRALYPQATPADKDDLERRMWRVRREITELERSWYFNAFLSYHSAPMPGTLIVPGTSPLASEGGVELGWRPPSIGNQNGRLVELFGRAFFVSTGEALDYDPKSLQFGFGVRWKPLSDQDLRLSAERLVKGGANARDAWMGRISYFWGDGVDLDPVAVDWNYTALYADLAYIPDTPHFTSLYGQITQGWRFRVGERSAVTPHVTLLGQSLDNGGVRQSRAEAGAGLTFTLWYDEDTYHAPRGQLDFAVEYRAPLATHNLHDDGHITAQFVLAY